MHSSGGQVQGSTMTGITNPSEEYFKDGLWGWATSTWKKLVADAAGHLQVDIVTSSLPAANPNIYNVTMTISNTEYTQALPSSTKKFLIKCREAYDIKLCFTSGASGTTYITIPSGMSYWEDLIQPANITLYFQCATAAKVTEIVTWS